MVVEAHARLSAVRRGRLGTAQALAGVAVALLAYELFTVVGWLSDDPHQITAYRTHDSLAWYAARVVEVVVLATVAGFLVHGFREYRRTRRLSVDALLVIGMATAAFWDPIYNWVVPAWLYSSNFLNVNDWLGHAPGILDPDAGRMPWPIVIVLVGYPLWGVGFAALINLVMDRVVSRRPDLRAPAIAAVAFATAAVITAVAFAGFETLGLMDAPGYRLAWLGNSQVVFFAYSGGLCFGGIACLRWFRDGYDRALFERDSRRAAAPGTATRILAAIAACQLIVILTWGVATVPFSLASSPYPRTHRDLINGLCNAPGITGTAYGRCPGTPGARLSIR